VSFSESNRREMASQMLDLHHQIQDEVQKDTVDPGKLMRLTAAGVAQTLMAQALTLSDGELPEADGRC